MATSVHAEKLDCSRSYSAEALELAGSDYYTEALMNELLAKAKQCLDNYKGTEIPSHGGKIKIPEDRPKTKKNNVGYRKCVALCSLDKTVCEREVKHLCSFDYHYCKKDCY